MGLGVRVTRSGGASLLFRPLSLHSLHGFLEVIPESLFGVLRNCGHNSLYKFYDRSTRKWVFAIFFFCIDNIIKAQLATNKTSPIRSITRFGNNTTITVTGFSSIQTFFIITLNS